MVARVMSAVLLVVDDGVCRPGDRLGGGPIAGRAGCRPGLGYAVAVSSEQIRMML